jgi:hypothetical protein
MGYDKENAPVTQRLRVPSRHDGSHRFESCSEHMSITAYDRRVLTIVTALTLSVIVLLALVAASGTPVGSLWFMPIGWFIGAVMVWGYGKYNKQ